MFLFDKKKLNNHFSNLTRGPIRVLAKADKFFKVLIGDHEGMVSMDRLKAAHVVKDLQVAQPPRQGRPPKSCLDTYNDLWQGGKKSSSRLSPNTMSYVPMSANSNEANQRKPVPPPTVDSSAPPNRQAIYAQMT